MKTILSKLALPFMACVILIATSCRKDQSVYTAHFYLADTVGTGDVSLYLSNEYIGLLPRLQPLQQFGCFEFDDPQLEQALKFPLRAGEYKVEARNAQGEVIIDGNFNFHSNGNGGSFRKGMYTARTSGNVMQTALRLE